MKSLKVVFETKHINYSHRCFPTNLPYPPRIGERVKVDSDNEAYFIKNKLPLTLKVIDVTWEENKVVCLLA